MAAVPVDSPPESSEEKFSNSMEDDSSDSENTNGVTETEVNGTSDKFWVRYSSLKTFLTTMYRVVGNQLITSEYFFLEDAKLMGDEKAKKLNDKCEDLFKRDLELVSSKLGFFSEALYLMKR